jgi:PKD repeat protein
LSEGASKEKIILGLPYYGMEWNTSSEVVPSSTTSYVSSRTYKTIRANASGNYSNRQWDNSGLCPYYTYYSSNWRQCFVDDEESLGYKYDFVNMMGIAGIGIWALGYDDGYTELWDLIREKFTNCGEFPCSGTFYDLGGPDRVYFDDSDYTFTIAPTGATQVSLEFPVFDVEAGSGSECNYDYIEIFDGPNTGSPSFGKFCNTTGNPGVINSSGNALTVRFYSDGATVNNGFEGNWTCVQDNIAPETQISAGSWQSDDFNVNFVDTDNESVDIMFYQVLDNDGTEWRANGNAGFFNDNFESSIHADWTNLSGSWSINNGHLMQSDESTSNQNLYADVTQVSGGVYLYHWQMKMSGTGSNRRAGLYIYCSEPELTQRGDAYMIYFRVDQNLCEVYKSVGNSISLYADEYAEVNADTWYDYKVLYNTTSGDIDVYQNNVHVCSWKDPNPLVNGNSISLRTGNCITEYDDIKVYKSRTSDEIVTLGANEDVRYQNIGQTNASCRIKSIIIDSSNNFSEIAGLDVNIDWTAPENIANVIDGVGVDRDTTYIGTELSANWTPANEPNSYVTSYEYCIGLTPGADDVVSWTDNSTSTSVTHTGLNLVSETEYFFSVRAKNIVNLFSETVSSDGILYVDPEDLTIADFTIANTSVCEGSPIEFINLSENETSVKWEITGPQNETTTQDSPSLFLIQGDYQVKLIAYGSVLNDTIIQNYFITVNPLPVGPLSVNASESTICQGESLQLSFSGGSGTNFIWYSESCGDVYVESGNDVIVEPVTTTTYFGRWENSCGVSNCESLVVEVNPLPMVAENVSATDLSICELESTQLTFSGGSGDEFNWYSDICGGTFVGSGNSLEVSPSVTNTYYGRWENTCGNSPCKSIEIIVNPLPEPPQSLTASTLVVCGVGSTILSFDGGSGNSFKWYISDCGDTFLGQGNEISVSPTETTSYYGRWENSCGFSDCAEIEILVQDIPVADFSAIESTLEISNPNAFFINLSQNASSYLWDFGDGQTSDLFEPWHAYNASGLYTVSLQAISENCGMDTKTVVDFIEVLDPSSIQQNIYEDLIVYPNPCTDKIIVELSSSQITQVKVYSLTGEEVFSVSGNSNKVIVDTHLLPKAVYLLKIITTSEIYYKQILVE